MSILEYGMQVHQASGMVSVQAGCTVDEALTKLQERARSTGQTIDEVAVAVVERRTRFSETFSLDVHGS
ncbi:MAG: ANTAR domain-containing protein [Acidimicrobiia bacterium]